MADNTQIEWNPKLWNPQFWRDGALYQEEKRLLQPLRRRTPTTYLLETADLFDENVPDDWIDRVFAVMALCPQHTFQVLTKRSDRMREYLAHPETRQRIAIVVINQDDVRGEARLAPLGNRAREEDASFVVMPLPNVWLGVSVEDQAAADTRIPDLLATPSAIRWISAEPLLGPVDLHRIEPECLSGKINAVDGWHSGHKCEALDWIVVGGESGPGARPMHPDWVRSLLDQCAAAGVPFFFKQWGEWVPVCGAVDSWDLGDNPEYSRFDHRDWEGDKWGAPYRPAWMDETEDDTVLRVGKKRAGHLLDGIEHNAMPGDA